jgi:hypothetical protein
MLAKLAEWDEDFLAESTCISSLDRGARWMTFTALSAADFGPKRTSKIVPWNVRFPPEGISGRPDRRLMLPSPASV